MGEVCRVCDRLTYFSLALTLTLTLTLSLTLTVTLTLTLTVASNPNPNPNPKQVRCECDHLTDFIVVKAPTSWDEFMQSALEGFEVVRLRVSARLQLVRVRVWGMTRVLGLRSGRTLTLTLTR